MSSEAKKKQQDQETQHIIPISCPKESLEKLGFVFGEPVDGLFINATFPEGWDIVQSTQHSLWSNLIDQKGRKRAYIFYNIEYKERKAELVMIRRYCIDIDYSRKTENILQYIVFDDSTIIPKPIYRTRPMEYVGECTPYLETGARQEAFDYLNKKYPKWRDIEAYWD